MAPPRVRQQYTLPPNLERMHLYALFCHHAFHKRLRPAHRIPSKCNDIDLRIRAELLQIVEVVFQATNNVRQMPWCFKEAVQLLQRDSRRRDGQEPNPLPGSGGPCKITVAPCVYLDKNQVVVGWHLPEALQSARLVSWYSALESAARDGNSPFWTSPEGDWRSNEELFEDSPNFPFGHVDLSPAGFYQDNQAIPTPSTSFTSPGRNGWGLLNDIQETLSIFGAVLAIVQPSVFYEGLNLFEKIYTRQTQIESTWAFRDLLALWGAPFTNVLIFSNHEAPFHRDLSSCPYAFEVFVSTGTSRNNRFVIPSFDSEYYFNPGTIIVFPPYVFQHGWISDASPHNHAVATIFLISIAILSWHVG
ncbi:hypothetical protein CC1G_15523 [Coprinopsis cinerea okayama7|uniref:Uncharacterized protein n=1 Tax=Coprinopsis cinerea (strain Okayama-7 / 130 / ATCC MYA-4618 / FGSC 9003) TaxID=240176 RepID=D6RNA4_COPC7|nr:hypothetical protein CC1G_15523 [Coprinopsis cinerea okayama7\|eukprot:XP_002910982.1 hypothetical protein CC1G_15523 [Coprinopsis cinerea okayama7\